MKTALTIWKVGECDWVLATSAKEAREILEGVGMDIEPEDEIRPLTDFELDKYKFIDEDRDESEEGTPDKTFREELAARIAVGDGPGPFASTEF